MICYAAGMDLKYGSPAREAFVTNVGLITSNGPHSHNVMPAEWTAQISYDPAHITVSIGPKKATAENILATSCFGMTIAVESQNVFSSMAGAFTGREYDKIAILRDMGFQFVPAKTIDVLMPVDGMLHVECEVVEHYEYPGRIMFVGKALSVEADPSKNPLIYHRGKYWSVGSQLEKPDDEQKAAMVANAARFKR